MNDITVRTSITQNLHKCSRPFINSQTPPLHIATTTFDIESLSVPKTTHIHTPAPHTLTKTNRKTTTFHSQKAVVSRCQGQMRERHIFFSLFLLLSPLHSHSYTSLDEGDKRRLSLCHVTATYIYTVRSLRVYVISAVEIKWGRPL